MRKAAVANTSVCDMGDRLKCVVEHISHAVS